MRWERDLWFLFIFTSSNSKTTVALCFRKWSRLHRFSQGMCEWAKGTKYYFFSRHRFECLSQLPLNCQLMRTTANSVFLVKNIQPLNVYVLDFDSIGNLKAARNEYNIVFSWGQNKGEREQDKQVPIKETASSLISYTTNHSEWSEEETVSLSLNSELVLNMCLWRIDFFSTHVLCTYRTYFSHYAWLKFFSFSFSKTRMNEREMTRKEYEKLKRYFW